MSDQEQVTTPSQIPMPNIVINNVSSNTNTSHAGNLGKPRSKIVTAILCLFLGVFGIHRFYTGHIITGILYACSFGILGIGVVLDLLYILAGSYRDANGVVLQ